MSGRGRGRGGRGWKPPTGAQLFLQRSAKESGLDDRNLRTLQDITRPPLFPDIRWHSSGKVWRNEEESIEIVQPKRSPSTIYLIRKAREISHRLQSSVFHVLPTPDADIMRYRKRSRSQISCGRAILEHVGKNLANSSYIPEELLNPGLKSSKRKKMLLSKAKKDSKDDSLEDANVVVKSEVEGEDLDEADEMGNKDLPEEEEDEAEDYVMNYYQSEDESDGGDDGEPTF